MESLRQYVLQLIAAALLCGIVTGLVNKGHLKEIVKIICGIFLSITALQPMVGMDMSFLTDYIDQFSDVTAEAVASGEEFARDSTGEIIKAECEAYILDKAAELNTQITVTVKLSKDNPPIPVSVQISGAVTPYIRLRLEEIIQQDLGITKENQIWTG